MTHKELVARGARWLERGYGCKVVLSEHSGITGETPDIIGWKHTGRSVLVEVKVSRSDFLADAKKPFRTNPMIGLGAERYYMAPKGMLKAEDLPEGWGLIEATAVRFKVAIGCRPRKDMRSDLSRNYEMRMLIAALYRVSQRLAPANLWDWLAFSNINTSFEQMQAEQMTLSSISLNILDLFDTSALDAEFTKEQSSGSEETDQTSGEGQAGDQDPGEN